jgi:hypothetical protein
VLCGIVALCFDLRVHKIRFQELEQLRAVWVVSNPRLNQFLHHQSYAYSKKIPIFSCNSPTSSHLLLPNMAHIQTHTTSLHNSHILLPNPQLSPRPNYAISYNPSLPAPAQDRLTPHTASPDPTHALQTAMRLHGVECAHVFGLAYLDAHSCPVSLVSYSQCADACLHSGVWIAHVLGRRYRTETE